MELRTLEYFLAIAQAQNITKAASTLNITQPTLSRQIHDLEKELGKTLFIRGNRKITLTQDGLLLRRRAEEIMSLVNKTETEIKSEDNELTGHLYIGAIESKGIQIIMQAINTMQQDHPHVHFHFYSGNGLDILEKINTGVLDFAIVTNDVESNQFHSLTLPYKDTWGLLMNKQASLSYKENIIYTDLQDMPLYLSPRQEVYDMLKQWIHDSKIEPIVKGTYNLSYNISLLIETNPSFYAFGFDGIINTDFYSSLTFKPFYPRLETGLNFIWKKYQPTSMVEEKFIDYVKKEIKE